MRRFTELFRQLDQTNKTNERVDALRSYFVSAPDADKIWALALFTGRRPPSVFKSRQLHEWALQQAGIPEWLFHECYNSVGDQAETISLVLTGQVTSTSEWSLGEWFRKMLELRKATDEEKRIFLLAAWNSLSRYETFVFNKLLMGSFRIGVSKTLVIRAVAEASGLDTAVVAHRVMGDWNPLKVSFHDLIHRPNEMDNLSQPYPFFLAYAIEDKLENLGEPNEWFAEWKWDGIRSQVVMRSNKLFVWSRGEELVTEKFPELHPLTGFLPDGTVVDGEILCFANDRPMPFNILQTRIGRKNLTKKILADAPVAFMAYDILEFNGRDCRSDAQSDRRALLEQLHASGSPPQSFRLSPLITFDTWDDLRRIHGESRTMAAEGFMLKRKSAQYQVGRKKGDWWKWKIDPLTADAVLVYAQQGHGRRTEL
jgi:DNA ligase-1